MVNSSVGRAWLLSAGVLLACFSGAACNSLSKGNRNSGAGIIVINAPASGEIRRVMVSEGTLVAAGAPIVEITVSQSAGAQPSEDPRGRAVNTYEAAQGAIVAAQAEAQRASVEVQRVTALVNSGSAPQSQLDAARAVYQKAQQQLENAQEAARRAQAGLVYQEGRAATNAAPVEPEKIFTARTPSAGTIRVINAKVGQVVSAGQPLATLAASD